MESIDSRPRNQNDPKAIAGNNFGLGTPRPRATGPVGRGRAGLENCRLPAARLVRRAARTVARAGRHVAPGRAGEAHAAAAILDLAAGRSPGRGGPGRAQDLSDRWAWAIRRH